MKCDLIAVSWNHLEFLKPYVEHVRENTSYPYRLIIVDNASGRETIEYLESLKGKPGAEIVILKNDKNLGFVRAVNQGLKMSDAPYVCIFNNDTLPGRGWLNELVDFAQNRPDVGLLNPICKGHVENNLSVNEYAETIAASNKGRFMEMNQCQGFCMLVKRALIDKIGYLDERFDTVGFDDTDYSMRAYLAGYKSVSVHSSYVYHKEHASFDKMGDRKKIQVPLENRYFAKWPRHLRIAVFFSASNNTSDEKISNLLASVLFFAREWCWVNLFIFGGKNTKARVEAVKTKIDFPLHQNIKVNYLKKEFRIVEIAARILERSFGTKKRKRYDAVISSDTVPAALLRSLCRIQKCNLIFMDFFKFQKESLEEVLTPFRKEGLKEKKLRDPMRCDIILPVCDKLEFTKKCIESIIKNTSVPYRLIVVNNGKTEETKKYLDGLGMRKGLEITVLHNEDNIGWVKALNMGLSVSGAPYVCFQNNDTEVTAGWLSKLINILDLRDDFGMINPTWEGKPISMSSDEYNSRLEKGNKKFVKTDWCRGFCVVMKRKVIEKIGRVDEIYGLGYLDDVDYSVRATEAGFSCLKALDTYVYHERNVTASSVLGKNWNDFHERNKRIYHKKWGRPLKIVLILDKTVCMANEGLEELEGLIWHLARKQHHVDIWSPRRLPKEKFAHTNVKVRPFNRITFKLRVFLELCMNKGKRPEKRYDGVFEYEKGSSGFVKDTVDALKEKTKEEVK